MRALPYPDFQLREATYNLSTLLAIGQRRVPIQSDAIRRLLFARNGNVSRKAKFAILFDHLVGSRKECWRYGEAERLRGLQIDNHQVFRRQLHGELRRLCATENVIDIARTAVKYLFEVGSVGTK
jgi:hypothetical protein